MRNLVVQVDIPGKVTDNVMHGYFNKLYDTSKTEFAKYAKNIGADYLCIHCKRYSLHPTYERFQIFEEEFDQYDNILYLDCDIIPASNAKNIFEEYKENDFAAFSEGSVFYGNNKEISEEFKITGRMENIIKRRNDKGYTDEEGEYLSQEWLENTYFNGGVFIISQRTRKKVRERGLENYLRMFSLFDQSALNKMVYENNIPFTHLSYKYNGLFHFYSNEIKSKIISKSYFIHFCGPMKNIYDELTKEYGDDWFKKKLNEEKIFKVVTKAAQII